MEFNNKPPKWDAQGTEPSAELQEKGFTAGYKPPATYFNYLFNKITACINELQTFLKNISSGTEKVGKAKTADTALDSEKLNSFTAKQIGESGAQNVIPYPHYQTTQTVNGITFTDNGDGTVHVSGTATASASHIIRATAENWTIGNGTYTLSGCPSGGSFSTYRLQLARFVNGTITSYANEYGTGAVTEITDELPLLLQIVIASGITIDATFKPMLERGSVVHDFVPYHYGGAYDTQRLAGKSADELLADCFKKTGGTVEFTKYDGFVVKRTTTSNAAITGIMFENASGKLGMIGFRHGKLQRSETNGSTSYDILDTSNIANYAVPIDGSVPMTGDLWFNGQSRVGLDASVGIQLTTLNDTKDESAGRALVLRNFGNDEDSLNALGYNVWSADGSMTYPIHHDGNSAKVVVSTTAPEDTSALWVVPS